jgi:hypothetical protein
MKAEKGSYALIFTHGFEFHAVSFSLILSCNPIDISYLVSTDPRRVHAQLQQREPEKYGSEEDPRSFQGKKNIFSPLKGNLAP